MNVTELEKKLLAAARATTPSEEMPYAFEKRILAHLASPPRLDSWALWSQALWRAAAPCVVVMLLLCGWSLFAPGSNPPTTGLSQELDNTVMAAVDQALNTDSTW
jgi:hypothetical protein